MKISIDEDKDILLEEVYNGIKFKTNDGEIMSICMRDSGFEFNYQGQWYSAQAGYIRKLECNTLIGYDIANNINEITYCTPIDQRE